MNEPRVACLTCTYGRFTKMRNCLAFFLAQDYPTKHLFILNNHPVPLRCDLPEVTVFNEPSDEPGFPRNRLLAKVGPEFDFVHTWDDDDAWLPWHLSQAVRQINVSPRLPKVFLDMAWKPARSWIHYERTGEYKLNSNNYEASMIVRRGYMQRIAYATASGNEHRPLLDALKAGKELGVTEVGARASYIYTWRGDFTHASAPLGSSPRETWAATLPQRDAAWRKLQTDTGVAQPPSAGNGAQRGGSTLPPERAAVPHLTPADIRPRYRDLLAHCRSGLSEYEALELHVLIERYFTAEAQRSQRTELQK